MSVVEILYFEGCPNLDETTRRVRTAVAAAAADVVTIRHVLVETLERAEQIGFLGSPSVRVDGVDVDPSARTRTDFGLQCRVYEVAGRLEGAPRVEWIRAALELDASPSAAATIDAAAPGPTACCGRKTP